MATEAPAPEPAPASAAPAASAPAPAPPTDPKMQSAVNFLLDPSVMGMPGPKLTPYLKQRLGLTDDQVKEAFKLASAAPRPRQDKIMTAVEFLENEQVKDKPLQMKVTYLKAKLEMTDPEIAAALSQTAGPPPPEAVQKAMSFLQTEAVKASPDNVAKAKYLIDKLSMKKEDVEAAFKACGMAMPALPDAPKDKQPEDAAKSAREERAASLEEKK